MTYKLPEPDFALDQGDEPCFYGRTVQAIADAAYAAGLAALELKAAADALEAAQPVAINKFVASQEALGDELSKVLVENLEALHNKAAQPAGEPVAWQSTFLGESILTADQKNGNYFAYSDEFLASHTIQLYTHPAPQVPMTDADILSDKTLRYYFGLNGGNGPVSDKGLKIVRAIEAFHRIGVKP